MAVKYIKDHKTQETVYPITKSECIIDAHSISSVEIDLLFDDSVSNSEVQESGMDYLNYNGLKHYHKKISEEVQTGLDNVLVDLTGYATESWVERLNYLTEHQDISGKVDVADFEEASKTTVGILLLFHNNTLWQTEDIYVKCDKSKTLEEAVSGESDVVYFTTDSHQIVLNGSVYSVLDLTGYATEQWVENKGYLTEHQDISGKVDVTDFEEATLVTSTALNYFGANKQDKTDTSLETENKTIVGAINEVNSKCEGSDVDLSNYLPLTGGTMTGDITFDENAGLHFQQAGSLTYSEQNGLALIADGSELHLRQDSINIVGSIYNNTGTISAAAFYETSDARKKDIKSDLSLDKCYDLIDKCQTVIYSLKDQTQELVGMIAQEIEEFFPEVVATDADGFKSLAYDRLVVICFKVLKDVIKRLEKLES